MKIAAMIFMMLCSIMGKAQVVPFYSAINDKYGYKDDKGKLIVPPQYDLAYPIEEGMGAVRLNGKYGYVNQYGKVVVPPKYEYTWKFIGGYAAVKSGDKYGFINQKGVEVIPPVYQDANNYHGTCCYKGQAFVKQDGKWKIIEINPGH